MAKKEKRAMKLSMNDMLKESSIAGETEKTNPSGKASEDTSVGLENFKFEFNDEFDEALKWYNKNINTHADWVYEFKPMRHIVVRAYVEPLKRTKGGLIKPNQAPAQARTRSGVGTIWVDDPFSFTRKAIIVSMPDTFSTEQYKVGDVIMMTRTALQKEMLGQGQDATPNIGNSYLHPDYCDTFETPLNPRDEAYGYFLITPNEVLGTIS